jgi:hypothetical protein
LGCWLSTALRGSGLAMIFITAISGRAIGGLGVFKMGLNTEWHLHQRLLFS